MPCFPKKKKKLLKGAPAPPAVAPTEASRKSSEPRPDGIFEDDGQGSSGANADARPPSTGPVSDPVVDIEHDAAAPE
eukprot:gene9976-8855_t